MTHFQGVFVQNLRYLRSKKGFSQVKLSELLDISPNYLNAIENGKNFPSPEVIQRVIDILEIMPYQLFLEYPVTAETAGLNESGVLFQELTFLKQQFVRNCDEILQKYEKQPSRLTSWPEK